MSRVGRTITGMLILAVTVAVVLFIDDLRRGQRSRHLSRHLPQQ